MEGRSYAGDLGKDTGRALGRFRERKMKITIKLTGLLYDEIVHDLARLHPFAAERVGFAVSRMGSLVGEGKLVLLNRYCSIPDEHYVEDPSVGARIGREAITSAIHTVYYGRAAREGVFHVHLHWYDGEPGMSGTDRHEIPKFMPGFQSVGRTAAHGIIILSRNNGSGWVWLPSCKEPMRAESINVIGVPVGVFDRMRAR